MSDQTQIEQWLSLVVDPVWYGEHNPDVQVSGVSPLHHFIEYGLVEQRDPNPWFDGAWYLRQNPDVAAAGTHPLLHYLSLGAAQGRDPHPRFDATWYVRQHPEAAGNPLLFHLRLGATRDWPTERRTGVVDYLPSITPPFPVPGAVAVDVIVPVYRGLELTRRCLESVLADVANPHGHPGGRPRGRILVIDDQSPEPALSAYLTKLARTGVITLLRNKNNLGFVASVNRGMTEAGDHDVVLLNNDTEVPPGWLARLQAQAYARPQVASVSPLSNNATICSYPAFGGGPMPGGMTLTGIDEACRAVNAGRFVTAPTTVGFCMYIRRAALDAVGLFDAETFGAGYGEENDFCLRATALGWTHHIACDTFVWHQGGASFGDSVPARVGVATRLLLSRHPAYETLVVQHVQHEENAPYRFAVTMALFRAAELPTVLLITHDLDGGVRRHVKELVARDAGQVHYLLLEPSAQGMALSVPALPDHPVFTLRAERWRDLARVVWSGGVSRVQIHHLMGHDADMRALLHELDVPFDVVAHDYFAICPQVTLLPWPAGSYCGEPGPEGCDACIASRPSHGATDILSWRHLWAWQFREAETVYVPSVDMLNRLKRYGLADKAVVRPLEHVLPGPWPLRPPPRPEGRLRVAVLGVLADHKGARVVASVAMAAHPDLLEIHLIGHTEAVFPDLARVRMTIHGPYEEADLPALLERHQPHVLWFPASWPETYSYTLSAAIEAGLPIVASDIGAFPERLAGRPLTWLMPPSQDPRAWLDLFDTVAETLSSLDPPRPSRARALIEAGRPAPRRPLRDMFGFTDLRRADRTAVVVIPETLSGGALSPCAHIRLLRPLDHPAIGEGLETTMADAVTALRYRADMILTQRYAIPTVARAEALAAHARRTGAMLVYDLDDDLLNIPPDHPEASILTPRAAVVERMIHLADAVRASTPNLAARLGRPERDIQVIGNALDERIWFPDRRRLVSPYEPVRLLLMGTATHDADFAMILPALSELQRQLGHRARIDMIGFAAMTAVPDWIRRVPVPAHAARSYAGFVHWITRAGPWDIGLAPLADSPFNACKSPIKTLDHAALGLATLASDVAAYQGSIADGTGGILVENTTAAWYEAMSRLVRDDALRQALAEGGLARVRETGTLEAQAGAWRRAWPRTGKRRAAG